VANIRHKIITHTFLDSPGISLLNSKKLFWMTQIDSGILQHKHGTKCKYATSELRPPLPKTRLGTLRPITIWLKIYQIASNM